MLSVSLSALWIDLVQFTYTSFIPSGQHPYNVYHDTSHTNAIWDDKSIWKSFMNTKVDMDYSSDGTLTKLTKKANKRLVSDSKQHKVILVYGKSPPSYLSMPNASQLFQALKCPQQKCILSFNNEDLDRSDAVVFLARRLPRKPPLRVS